MRIPPLRTGLFGIGLDANCSEPTNRKLRLEGYLAQVGIKLARSGFEIINPGLIATPEKAMEASHAFRRADGNMNFLHIISCALFSEVLPVVRRAKVPVFVLKPRPEMAIDYESFKTNSPYRFPMGALAFVNHWNAHGPAHHCAIGVGHIAYKLTKLAALLGIHIEKNC